MQSEQRREPPADLDVAAGIKAALNTSNAKSIIPARNHNFKRLMGLKGVWGLIFSTSRLFLSRRIAILVSADNDPMVAF
jgi:hypothetical protein